MCNDARVGEATVLARRLGFAGEFRGGWRGRPGGVATQGGDPFHQVLNVGVVDAERACMLGGVEEIVAARPSCPA